MRPPFALLNALTMRGVLGRCWLFAFRTSPSTARRFLPAPLEPVRHGAFAYWNVVVCHVGLIRPAFVPAWVPAWLGLNYWHVAYRLYARLPLGPNRAGCPPGQASALEGLYFVRSDCNHPLIGVSGRVLTDFRFHLAGVAVEETDAGVRIAIRSPDAPAEVRLFRNGATALPPGSPFGSLAEAEAALKYRPFGLSLDRAGRRANVVRIVRDEAAWRAHSVAVEHARFAFFDGIDAELELCTEVDAIEYQWNRGRIVRLR